VAEERLADRYVGGAARAGDTVRRSAGPWTTTVDALLAHLAEDAYTCLMRTNIDVLAMGSFLLLKDEQLPWSEETNWREEIPLD
jgi:hypothetical protein